MRTRVERRACARLAGAVLLLAAADPAESEHAARREHMVRTQIEARGVRDPRVLKAMRAVPRHRFVRAPDRALAYEDRPLSIGKGQTISQPYMVAVMAELLAPEPGDRVLEVGTGSGYAAAVLSRVVAQVYTIEIVPELARSASARLAELGYVNVEVVTGDGFRGLPDRAPFDGIVVTAAPREVPEPLLEQLAPGARLVIPVGGPRQQLRVLERTERGVETRTLFDVRFVPMTGEAEKR